MFENNLEREKTGGAIEQATGMFEVAPETETIEGNRAMTFWQMRA